MQSKISEVLSHNYVQIYLSKEELEKQETKELIEKYKKQKKKEIKPKPKEKTYVEQIEEQKHAVKSQIISKKID